MKTFFAIIGIITVLVFLRKLLSPSESTVPLPNEREKRRSLERMARNSGTTVSNLKAEYFKKMKGIGMSAQELDEFIDTKLFEDVRKESLLYRIHPKDTASAFLIDWTREFHYKQEILKTNNIIAFLTKTNAPESSSLLTSLYAHRSEMKVKLGISSSNDDIDDLPF